MSPVSEEELSALADGRLEEPRRSEVQRAIEADPILAAKLGRYQDQIRGLHALYDGVLSEPVPARLRDIVQSAGETKPRPQTLQVRSLSMSWRAAAAILGVFIVGLAGGWLGRGQLQADKGLLQSAVKQAVLAHQMHELAVADKDEALGAAPDSFAVSAESNPFQVPLRVPNTAGASNFVPVGFQSASSAAGPTVQLAYRDVEGKEVTLFVQPHSASRSVPYSTSSQDGFNALYWIDGPLVYVLVGEADEDQLRELADSFYSSAGLMPAAQSDKP